MAEIVRIASEEVRVVELTLEGDWYADKWRRQGEEQQKWSPQQIREAAESREVRLITHADPHLPFCSPLPAVRQGAAEELQAAGRFASLAGAEWLTVHLDRGRPDTSAGKRIAWYREAILGMTEPRVPVLIENAPFQLGLNQVEVILGIAEAVSAEEGVQVGATFDIAHALIEGHGDLGSYLEEPRYWELVRHVHVSEPDLSGPNADRHLPLGMAMANWRELIGEIMARKTGEEQLAITLEVHSQEPEYLRANLELLRAELNR
jgi:sugar phosphate isomerase/epimerase